MLKRRAISIISLLVLVTLVFVGCDGQAPQTEPQGNEPQGEAKLEGTVTVVGSTSVQPLAQNLADAFESVEPGIKVDIQGVGSSAGVKAAHEGTANIGTASRELKSAEEEWGLTKHVIARDGIAVVVHPSNSVSDLSQETITKIFKGEIKNWKEVGGADKDIIVISREAGSGTRGAFEEIMKLLEKNAEGKKVSVVREDAIFAEGNGAVKANVAKKETAIGYVSLGYLDDSIKALKVDGVDATVENIKSEQYPVARPFLMLTKGEIDAHVKAYLDFIMSDDGQAIVAEKFISVK